jgi:hypothetical protein
VTDPNAQDPKPAGSKPAEPTSPPPGAYFSPRLREKLESTEPSSSEDWPPKGSSVLPSILIGVAVVAVIIGGFLGWRSVAQKQSARAMAAAAAHADSLAAAAHAESLALAARADSAAADSVLGKPGGPMAAPGGKPIARGGGSQAGADGKTASAQGSQASSGGAGNSEPSGSSSSPGEATTPAPATDGYGIDVGTFLLEDRAQSERDRLSQSTGLAGLVDPTSEGYRVILGKYRSRGAAEKKAAALADSGQVREAHVVPRPK